MAGAGVSVLFHQWPWLVLSTDTRASVVLPAGCKLTVPGLIQVGPNQWASGVFRDLRDVPSEVLPRSAFHIGVETTGRGPLVRATAGGGWLWSARPVPFGTATIGLGSRGKRMRFYSELEASVARVRVNAIQSFYHMGSTGASGLILDSEQATTVVLHPKWAAVHMGLEIPLVSP